MPSSAVLRSFSMYILFYFGINKKTSTFGETASHNSRRYEAPGIISPCRAIMSNPIAVYKIAHADAGLQLFFLLRTKIPKSLCGTTLRGQVP
jgi:hypothetical protein